MECSRFFFIIFCIYLKWFNRYYHSNEKIKGIRYELFVVSDGLIYQQEFFVR